ncbi:MULTISPECIES: LytTR family DNA-binding domain-containing protein [Paraburkholderia]|uniref:LytTR family DNA-binding domain-containing protein n=1 Tax=Paraburkholderia unamae TaxID=219649 RepID=A0ACC6RDF0_9BURK
MKPFEHAMPTTDARRAETFQHRLEQFNPGVVWLDAQGRVSAFNDVALQIHGPAGEQSLGVAQDKLFAIDVVQLHPAKNRVILIDLKDVVRSQGDGHYTTIVTKDDRYLSNLPLATSNCASTAIRFCACIAATSSTCRTRPNSSKPTTASTS